MVQEAEIMTGKVSTKPLNKISVPDCVKLPLVEIVELGIYIYMRVKKL